MSAGLRVLAVTGSGGVLLDLIGLQPWLSRQRVVWAAVDAPDTRVLLADQDVRWVDDVPPGNPIALMRALRNAWRMLSEIRPNLVVSAGTSVAVSYFLAARARRTPTIWLDTFNIVARPGRVARLCARLSAVTLVQRPALLPVRPRPLLIGELW